MTIPTERTQAVLNTEQRILNLHYDYVAGKDYGDFVMVRAGDIIDLVKGLKHYPSRYELTVSHEKCPEIWGEQP